MIKYSPDKLKKTLTIPNELQNWKQMTLHIHYAFHFSSILFEDPTPIFIIETTSWRQGLWRVRHVQYWVNPFSLTPKCSSFHQTSNRVKPYSEQDAKNPSGWIKYFKLACSAESSLSLSNRNAEENNLKPHHQSRHLGFSFCKGFPRQQLTKTQIHNNGSLP